MVLKNYKKQYHNDIKLTNGFTVDVIEKHESGKDFFKIVIIRELTSCDKQVKLCRQKCSLLTLELSSYYPLIRDWTLSRTTMPSTC